MNKFWGTIGFVQDVETSPDVWELRPIERKYSCEKLKSGMRWSENGRINDEAVTVENRISILADPFALNALSSIRYIVRHGSKWKITSVEEAYPRLILTIGGIYHGETH